MNEEQREHVGRGSRHPRRRATDALEIDRIFVPGSEMGALMRSIDWSNTPLGPVEDWSPALRTMVEVVLHNRFPMLLWWGPKFVQFYNDAYLPIPGNKHPRAMGQQASECFAEIWHVIGPMIEAPFRGEGATTSDDLSLMLLRNGFLEETHFKVAYSPVPDDTVEPTRIGGVLATVAETTEQVFAERQLRTLRELGARAAEAKTADEACAIAGATLRENDADIPFALFYLVDERSNVARLAGSVGFETSPSEKAPSSITLDADEESQVWPLSRIIDGGKPEVLEGLRERMPGLPSGRWSEAPRTAIAFPLTSPGQAPYGALICGVSPHRELDSGYRTFFELAASQVVTAIRSVKAYEEEKRRAETLAKIDRAKTVFFSNVSHEFRTPLTLMLGPTEDLLAGAQGELTPSQRAQLELVRRNELRLYRLVNALLDFSRIEAGRAQALFEPTDLASVTRDLASFFRAAVERAGLAFIVRCPSLDEPVYVDRDLWEKIVLNLLSNAFKFTFEGKIEISLESAPGAVVLRVSDTGVGVPANEVPHLFDRFHRVEGTRARTYEGSGIGLALVRELVGLHGGTIVAESSYGIGTTFTVTIPKGAAHLPRDRIGTSGPRVSPLGPATFVEEALLWLSQEEAPTERAGPRAETDGAAEPEAVDTARSTATAGLRILVVDDNADMRDYIRRILSGPWVVETVNNGASALEAVRARRPDLVLTDVMMPILDGFGLLRELRAQAETAHIPVIMLSARAGEEASVECLEAGADDYLVKPFSARELVARVKTHLELANLREQQRAQSERLYSLFMQAPVAIAVLRGADLVYEHANPLYIEKIALGRNVVGTPFLEGLPELRDQVADVVRRMMRTGEIWTDKDVHLHLDRDRDGVLEDAYFSWAGAPIRNREGVFDRVMLVVSEVTDQVIGRRKAEEAQRQIARSASELRQAMALRDQFLTVASHELRTPLTTVQLQADGLVRALQQSGAFEPNVQRSLGRAERLRGEAARLEQLLEGMIDVFSLSRERVKLNVEELDLAVLGKAVVDRVVRDIGTASSINFRAESVRGRWDRQRLDQILTQLLANALKFGGGKPVDVVVSAAGDAARLSVTDQGIGIAPEDHQRIFGRFERAAPARHYGGFGLGLWIVKELVDAMGGTVRVDSMPKEGATFTVELPRRR